MFGVKRHITTMTNVAAGSTGNVEELIAEKRIGIRQIEITCDSTDYDFMIYDRAAGGIDSKNMVYKITGINKVHRTTNFPSGYLHVWNTLQDKIYAQVKNNDGANATGTITVKLFYEVSDAIE